MFLCWKIAPALACGNTIVFKPSEFTPLCTLRMASLIAEAGFPPGVFNIVTGTGPVVGEAMSLHMGIEKISFTGSTMVGRRIMECAAKSNLKNVTLECGGKSPNIIFNDADLDLAISWTSHGILWVLACHYNVSSRAHRGLARSASTRARFAALERVSMSSQESTTNS